MTPTDRRVDQINRITENFDHNHPTHEDRELIAGRIRNLYGYGRTARWNLAVSRWAVEVETAENDETFVAAFFRGAVSAGWAA